MIDYANELRKAYHGDAWHGDNISALISRVGYEQAFLRPIPGAHTIAEIVSHLSSWTEEVLSRLMGQAFNTPSKGDWPIATEETNLAWNKIVSDFQLANEKLINFSMGMPDEQWKDYMTQNSGGIISYFELLNGLVQHHVYHAGQIALLLKFK